MARDKASTVGPFFRELVSFEVYKRNQGRIVRQVTFTAIAIVLGIGCWRMSVTLDESSPTVRYLMPTVLAAAGLWISYRAVNWPRFADFLIAVEAEVYKVSWPDRPQLFRASAVVMATIFTLAALLFAFDLIWQNVGLWLGILGN